MSVPQSSLLHRILRPFGAVTAASLLSTAVAPAARADDSDACRDAEAIVGKAARRMTAAQCTEAVRAAEEEQWQLWLDLAFAEESSGNHEKAIETYRRFVKSVIKRGPDLAEPWPGLRDEAIFSIDRLETGLLKTRARVVIDTVPPGLMVRFVNDPRRPEAAAPLTRYLEPGTHVIATTDPATGRARELSFTVELGQSRELKLDLRADSPINVTEKPLPNVAGGGGGADPAGEGPPGVHVRGDDDDALPPRTDSSPTVLRRIGIASLGVGIAGLAVGTGFILTSNGMSDEAACSGAACDVETGTRAHLRNNASIAEDRAIAAFVTGGVFLVGGALMVALDLMREPEAEGEKQVQLKSIFPAVGAGHAGLGAAFGF